MLSAEGKTAAVAVVGFTALSLATLFFVNRRRDRHTRTKLLATKGKVVDELNTSTKEATSGKVSELELEVVDSLVVELMDIISAGEDEQILAEALDAFLVSGSMQQEMFPSGRSAPTSTIHLESEDLAKECLKQIQVLSSCIRNLQYCIEKEKSQVTVESKECERLRGRLEKEKELRQEAEHKVSLMRQSIKRLEMEVGERKKMLQVLQQRVEELSQRVAKGADCRSDDFTSLHSEQDRINKEKEELRKRILVLAKAKSERRAKREELMTRVNAKRQELDVLIAENDQKRIAAEERRREEAMCNSSYGPYESESEYDSNASIFGSFGVSSSESDYGRSEEEEDFSEDRWG
eukprot:TRINITY_DN15309_c0_g1_i1.p1 TRINITY_DN15309_c0_g1~~TRINITY_DN15309_c0_g1_i1.p1  ORF type:complete len:350 (-),score=76.07 TRINITY_DN15309_c0_g1_i1:104-1153(-)